MIAAWIVYALLAGGLLGAAAHAIASAARIAKLPTRWVWSAALVATVVLAGVAPFRGGEATHTMLLPARATAPATLTPARSAGLSDAIAAGRALLVELTERALAALEHALAPVADRWIAASLILVGVLALVLLAAVYTRYARLRRRWPSAELAGTRVRVSPDTGPAVIGVTRPEIVVPTWLLERSEHEQSLVIAHEAEHVRARDPLLLGIGCVAVALMPWNPIAWWMLARLRLAVELDCDRRVLQRGVTPRAYGTLLIDLAGHCSGFPAGAPALADTSSHLERRLVAMRHDRIRFPLIRAVGAGALALAAVLAACEAKLPTDADVQQMDVAAAEQTARSLKVLPGADSLTTYTVDGVPVTAESARAIPAKSIATLNVSKSPNGHAEIQITTKPGGDTLHVALDPTRVRLSGLMVATVGDSTHGGGTMVTSFGDAGQAGARRAEAGTKVSATTFSGLVYIDGVRSTLSAMNALSPKEIASVDVMKGPAAVKAYADPAAANGVISIKTLKAAKQN